MMLPTDPRVLIVAAVFGDAGTLAYDNQRTAGSGPRHLVAIPTTPPAATTATVWSRTILDAITAQP